MSIAMNKTIENHPTIQNANEIADICRPLKMLGITYFCHVMIKDNQFLALANNPAFHRHYLSNKYYNADIHMAQNELSQQFIVWDAIECRGVSRKMDEAAQQFGVKHTFTITEKNPAGNQYYHFATDVTDTSINQVYLTNLEMLKLFIRHFNYNVSKSKELSTGYKLPFGLSEQTADFNLNTKPQINSTASLHQEFINSLTLGNQLRLPNGMSLTGRQIEILYWLHLGKTIHDIAALTDIAEITVNKHIAEIKMRLECYTQFQLGEWFAKIFAQTPGLIGALFNLHN